MDNCKTTSKIYCISKNSQVFQYNNTKYFIALCYEPWSCTSFTERWNTFEPINQIQFYVHTRFRMVSGIHILQHNIVYFYKAWYFIKCEIFGIRLDYNLMYFAYIIDGMVKKLLNCFIIENHITFPYSGTT